MNTLSNLTQKSYSAKIFLSNLFKTIFRELTSFVVFKIQHNLQAKTPISHPRTVGKTQNIW